MSSSIDQLQRRIDTCKTTVNTVRGLRNEQHFKFTAESRTSQEALDRKTQLYKKLLNDEVEIDAYLDAMKDIYDDGELPPKNVLYHQALLCYASHLVEVKLHALKLAKNQSRSARKYMRTERKALKTENRKLSELSIQERGQIATLIKHEHENCRSKIEAQEHVKAHLEATIALQQEMQATHHDLSMDHDVADYRTIWSLDSFPSRDDMSSFVTLGESSNDVMSINEPESLATTMTKLLDDLDSKVSPPDEDDFVLV